MGKLEGTLSDRDKRVYATLRRGDTAISVLFRAVYGRWPESTMSPRAQQMSLSSYRVRLNRKLEPHGLRVVPGTRRRTYRIIKIDG